MLVENLMGSTTKVKILRLFYEYPNRTFTTREIIQNAKIGAGYGLRCLNALEMFGILIKTQVGREKRYKINKKSECYQALYTLFSLEQQKYARVSYIHRGLIADAVEKLDIVLFGSVAAGTATLDSDVDLLVISRRPRYVKTALRNLETKSKIKIQPVVFSQEKLDNYVKNRDRFLRSIAKEHLFVRGQKKTREMIENV